ncbi:MAG: hypothetical protein HQL87_05150 [Magnetococcales bacterium]|nr:hypothetical protein [Magnetococcales bacterium]
MGNALAFFLALISTLWTWTLIGLATFIGYQVSQAKNLGAIPGFDALPAFLRLPLQHQTDNTIVFTLAGVIVGFLLFFLLGYVWQALQDFVRLALVKGSLEKARRAGRLTSLSVSEADKESLITWRWTYYPLMTRLWREYAETLHRQTVTTALDATPQVRYRSTLSAETIFSTQALVDVPMRVEFFRHLPGILTGAGIVSTFAGILLGLSAFDPSVEVQQITFQLKNLFSGITTAFIASFFAIFAAILVTIIEKFLLHWRYAQVALLQHYMDDLFRAGIEPEYLAHLVQHGQMGLQQLQTEMGRLTASVTTSPHPLTHPAARSSAIQPLDPYAQTGLGGPLADNAETLQRVLSQFLLEFSQLLHKTVDAQGRRREEGRTFEIQLLSVGERLDVAMGEFAHAVVSAKTEMADNHAVVQDLLHRQLAFLERLDAQFEQTSRLLQHADRAQTGNNDLVTRLGNALDLQTAAMRDWNRSVQELSSKWPTEEAVGRRIQETIQGLSNPLLPAEAVDRRMQEMLQTLSRQLPTEEAVGRRIQETIQGLSSPLLPAEAVDRRMEEMLRALISRLPSEEAVDRRMQEMLQVVLSRLPSEEAVDRRMQEMLQVVLSRLPSEEAADRRMQETLQGLTRQLPTEESVQQRLQETLESVMRRLPTEESVQQRLQETLERVLRHLPSEESVQQRMQETLESVMRRLPTEESVQQRMQETLESVMRRLPTEESVQQRMQETLERVLRHLPSEESVQQRLQAMLQGQEMAFRQWTQALDGLLQQCPSKEEWLQGLHVERHQQTELLQGLQNTLDSAVRQFEQTRWSVQQVDDKQTGQGEMVALLGNALERQTSAMHDWNQSLQALSQQCSAETAVSQRIQETLDAQSVAFQQWTHALEGLLQQWPSRDEWLHLVQAEWHQQTTALHGLQQTLDQSVGQVPDKGDMARLLTEIQTWRASLEEGVARYLQTATDPIAQQLTKLEQEIHQFKELSAYNASHAGLLMQGLADQFSRELNATLQEKMGTASGQEMAEKVAELLFARLDQTFGTLAKGLFELRERFSSERDTVVATMEGWRADSSRSDQEKDQKMEQKISEVISHVNTHHTHLIQVIDELNRNLSQDLDGMRGGLLHNHEENTQKMVQKVSDLGRVLEEVISSVGQEQTVFIEMLGERLEALRRRLRTK